MAFPTRIDLSTQDRITLRGLGLTSDEIDQFIDDPIKVAGQAIMDAREMSDMVEDLQRSNEFLRNTKYDLENQVEALVEANLQYHENNKRLAAIREGLLTIMDGADLGNGTVVRSGIAEIASALESYTRPDRLTSSTD